MTLALPQFLEEARGALYVTGGRSGRSPVPAVAVIGITAGQDALALPWTLSPPAALKSKLGIDQVEQVKILLRPPQLRVKLSVKF